MKERRPVIDWQEVHTRIERTQRMLEAGGHRPPEEVRRILQERAQALACPLAESPIPENDVLQLLIFSLSGEQYGIETAHVLEVIPLRDLMPVPCTPSFVLGLVNYRGRILPVLDFRRLVEPAAAAGSEGSRVVAVEAGGMTFGIPADVVVGTMEVAAQEVAPPPLALSDGRQAFLQGVTGALVAVLDLEALARDPRMAVNEEVSQAV